MDPDLRKKLFVAAMDAPGIRRFKIAAAILDKKGNLVSLGRNSRKTHPIMMNEGYREEQIYIHAEADAIIRALRIDKDLRGYHMAVLRVKKDSPGGKWIVGCAKPCKGCMNLIGSVGIESVEWSDDQ